MSLAEPLALCSTCLERPVRWGDECMTCATYRKRRSKQRPADVIVANNRRRSEGRGQAVGHPVLVELEVLAELRSTLSESPPVSPGGELCAPCGTVDLWAEGKTMPLCRAHRGILALILAVRDEPGVAPSVLEALTV